MFCILSQLFVVAIVACCGYTHPCQVLWWELWLVQMLDDSFSRRLCSISLPPSAVCSCHTLGSSSQLHLPCDVTEQRGSTLACALEIVVRGISPEVTALASALSLPQCHLPSQSQVVWGVHGGRQWWGGLVLPVIQCTRLAKMALAAWSAFSVLASYSCGY